MIRDLSNQAVQARSLTNRGGGDPRDAGTSPLGPGSMVTPQQLASYWGVHVRTIYRDIEKGALRARRLPGGQYRIRLADAQEYGKPVE